MELEEELNHLKEVKRPEVIKALKDARALIQDTKIAAKRETAYNTLISIIEDYNIKFGICQYQNCEKFVIS